jgi:hypothetical protein
MSVSGNGNLFKVHGSKRVLNILKDLQERATESGRGEQFQAALQAMYDRLRKNPKGFGEPLYRIPALKLVVYLGVVNPVALQYAVHDEKPLVFLKWAEDISLLD